MRIWRKESLSYYTSIWVGAREKIGDNVGTKVFNTHFNMFCRRVAELWFFCNVPRDWGFKKYWDL